MTMNQPPGAALAGYLRAVLGAHAARLRAAVKTKDRGASAVELAIITAVIVAIAIAVLVVVKNFVTTQSGNITKNQNFGG
jgi:hypothetical protein